MYPYTSVSEIFDPQYFRLDTQSAQSLRTKDRGINAELYKLVFFINWHLFTIWRTQVSNPAPRLFRFKVDALNDC